MVRSLKSTKARQHGACTAEYLVLLAILFLAASGIPELTRTMGEKLVRNDFFNSPQRPDLLTGGGTEGGIEGPIELQSPTPPASPAEGLEGAGLGTDAP